MITNFYNMHNTNILFYTAKLICDLCDFTWRNVRKSKSGRRFVEKKELTESEQRVYET